jgi:hypothetical protein
MEEEAGFAEGAFACDFHGFAITTLDIAFFRSKRLFQRLNFQIHNHQLSLISVVILLLPILHISR